jgi:hypothetical protein
MRTSSRIEIERPMPVDSADEVDTQDVETDSPRPPDTAADALDPLSAMLGEEE